MKGFFCFLISLIFFISCVTYNKDYKITKVRSRAKERKIGYQVLPSSLKILQNDYPSAIIQDKIELFSAKGEGESAQVLVLNYDEEQYFFFDVSDLIGPDGISIKPEFGRVDYVPVKKPSIIGFGKIARFPDPIVPTNKAKIKKNKSQTFFYTVYVPPKVNHGIYEGKLTLHNETSEKIEIPVRLKVYNVTLPKVSYLKTWFGPPSSLREPYYEKDVWTKEKKAELYKHYLKYRINIGTKIDMQGVISRDNDGSLIANWENFDKEVEEKLDAGLRNFDVYFYVPLDFFDNENKTLEEKRKEEYTFFYNHLLEKNWVKYFYWYNFDEPRDNDIDKIINILKWGNKIFPQVKSLIPFGLSSNKGMKKLSGYLDVWVPHIDKLDEKFFDERKTAGDEVWIYTCMQTAYKPYPDNWKIDINGTSHRALGWWLFKYNIEGYLYWATGYWQRRNPWEDTETYILANGDGSILYPPLDKKSLPYPSMRLHIIRDGFEDFDLLTMLKLKYKNKPQNEEVQKILSADSIIFKKNRYTNDDFEFIKLHKRILELLET